MKAQVISFHCVLKNKLGRILSTSTTHDVLTIDGKTDLFLQGLHEGLQNIKQGEKREIFLPAGRAYGFYDLEKIKRISVDDVENFKLGQSIRLESDLKMYRVIGIENDFLILDGNHPLAGQDLIFEIEATQVRNAKPEEIGDEVLKPVIETFH